jgi:intracellular sulfur oxidation DsrE/DsrF family protein
LLLKILTQKQPVVAVLLSLSRYIVIARILVFNIALFLCVPFSYAQSGDPLLSENADGYVARILNDSPEEVANALERVEKLYSEGRLPQSANPIAIILHGPEVEIFFKDNYEEYKRIVDLAARLSAFGVVDVRVCETQSGIMGRGRSSIHSFIGTVPFGPTAVKQLLDQQNYVYF